MDDAELKMREERKKERENIEEFSAYYSGRIPTPIYWATSDIAACR